MITTAGRAVALGLAGLLLAAAGAPTAAAQCKEIHLGDNLAAAQPVDRYGAAVAVDGDRLILGAPGAADANVGFGACGTAQIWDWNGSQWVQDTSFPGPVAQVLSTLGQQPILTGGGFGTSVDVDGDRAVVGVPFWDTYCGVGLALCFRKVGGAWAFDNGFATSGTLGESVSISGSFLALGDSALALAWVIPELAGAWKIGGSTFIDCSSSCGACGPGSEFGAAVAVSQVPFGGGYAIAIGAPGDDACGTGKGLVQFYVYDGAHWTANACACDGSADFGRSVALDGTQAVAGGPLGSDCGAQGGKSVAFVWNGSQYVQAGDWCGSAHALLGSGSAVSGAIGLSGMPHGAAFAADGGAVVLLRLAAGTWTWTNSFAPSDVAGGDLAGAAVALSGTRAVIGVPGAPGGGAVYTYDAAADSSWPPFTNLGFGLPGSLGKTPQLAGHGSTCGNDAITLTLNDARPLASAHLVLGFSPINAPFKGGTLVPSPAIVFDVTTDATGAVTLPATFPPGVPTTLPIVLQYWIEDAAAVKQLAASNSLAVHAAGN